MGGLNLRNPAKISDSEFNASRNVCRPLIDRILRGMSDYSFECLEAQMEAKLVIKQQRGRSTMEEANELRARLPGSTRKAMDLASERGASNWLTSLPIQEFGFCLHKRAFADALALRYGWQPSSTPMHCVCGSSFTVQHVLSCPKGGYPTIRHNELRDITASLLTEVCHDVRIEPDLQPLTGENFAYESANSTDGARLDIAVNGFWGGRYEKSYLDVRVFNPLAASNSNMSRENCYRKHEVEKKRIYEQRIREVEHTSFTPLVFSATGGMAKQATTFYKRLASMLADKWGQTYSATLCWLRCRISFSLLRSAIQCIRGARSSRGSPDREHHPIDLVNSESELRS